MNETWKQRAKLAMKGRITQEQLAEKLDMTQGGVSSWLRGATHPNLEDINRIADAIGVSRVWLTHGLGYQSGAGKTLIDLLLTGTLQEGDLQALATVANQLAAIRAPIRQAVESADFLPPTPEGGGKARDLADRLAKVK